MVGTKYEAVYAGVDGPPVVNMRIDSLTKNEGIFLHL